MSDKVKVRTLCEKRYDELSNFKKKINSLKLLCNKKSIYKKYIKSEYDVEIAFLEGPITRLFSVEDKNVKKIAWIHNDISKVFGTGLKAKIKKIWDRKTYSKYETLIFVSIDNLKEFNKEYKDIRNKYLEPIKKDIIYNYIDKEAVKAKAQEKMEVEFNKEKINFVTVARLVPQKAMDRLVKVHEMLIRNGLEHNFYVIGDGPEREKLEKAIKEKEINNTFHLLGKKENPYPYIKNADYFCLLSRFEGYGMVLEEAKILDKPIIITDTAAREVVERYEKSVILENTEEGIYKGLKQIIIKPKNSKKTKENDYDNSKIIEKIEKLLEE